MNIKEDRLVPNSCKKVTTRNAKAGASDHAAAWVRVLAKCLLMLTTFVSLGLLAPKIGRSEGPCPNSGPNSQIDPSLLPMKPGMVVATCFAGYVQSGGGITPDTNSGLVDAPVVAIIDGRTPFTPNGGGQVQLGLNWCAPKYHNDNGSTANQWRSANLGPVFGITLDNQNPPNIYVTAATVYGPVTVTPPGGAPTYGPNSFVGGTAAGGGQVFRLDGTTGAITKFARLSDPISGAPNSGTGLGNVCYDEIHRQLFVTDFDTGRIFRLPVATQPYGGLGWSGSTWDHGVERANATNVPGLTAIPDNTSSKFTPLGRRTWAVAVNPTSDTLFYSVWGRDSGRPNGVAPYPGTLNEIWSVPLNPVTGDFAANARPTREIGDTGTGTLINPTSSIAFSPSGSMFLAERVRNGDMGLATGFTPDDAHEARVLEYVNSSGWIPSGRNFSVGNVRTNNNSAGGVDLDGNGNMWGTGDALRLTNGSSGNPPSLGPMVDTGAGAIYGVQRTLPTGNSGDSVNFPPTYVGLSSVYIDLDGVTNSIEKSQIGAIAAYRSVGDAPPCDNCCGEKPHYDDQTYTSTFTGQVAVATGYASNLADPVLRIFDLKNQASAPLNTNYAPPTYSGLGGLWNKGNLGNIFGETLDDAGNIYVTATTAYNSDYFPTGATGGEIYKIDGASGNIVPAGTWWAQLPNGGILGPTGLGNISFDCEHGNFYVSDMEDGLIYRLDRNGQRLSSWDHGSHLSPPIMDTDLGFTPLGRRIWGLQAHCGRLYYAVWWEDTGRPDPVHSNEIWSVALSPSGDFVAGTQKLEVSMPPVSGPPPLPMAAYSNPVSDISFGPTGTMLLTERPMQDDTMTTVGLASRAVECTLSSGAWNCNDTKFQVGFSLPPNVPGTAEGGGDYDFSAGGRVWVTGYNLKPDFHVPPPPTVYIDGLQGLPGSGGASSSSILIDLNSNTSVDNSREIGDVEIPCPACEISGTVVTPTTASGAFTYQFTITNHSNQPAAHLIVHPVNGTTATTFNFSPLLQPGQTSQLLTVPLTGFQPGDQVCFSFNLLSASGLECCSTQVCVTIPVCYEVIDQSVQCLPGNMARVTVTLRNLETYTLYHSTIIPPNGKTANPNFFSFTPPVPPYGTTTVSTVISPVAPGELVPFTLVIHASDLNICCSRELSFTADCPPEPGLMSAASRMTHGTAGDFDIPLPLDGTLGIEDRQGAIPGAKKLVFTFNQEMSGGDASVMMGTAQLSGAPVFKGNQMIVNLTDVASGQILKLNLNVMDSSGLMHSPASVSMGVLFGDVTGNGWVNSGDVSQTKLQSGQAVTATNFRMDVNANGVINATDVSTVKQKSGTALP